ncbi:hypothetical protein AQV86_04475 [Nanohaloarchaea archaeon SG9]|nr:hypothetical protein AQV86_04475 [Nanohaloarchaea archaeon SG9]
MKLSKNSFQEGKGGEKTPPHSFSHFFEQRTGKMKKKNTAIWIAVLILLTPFIAYGLGPYTDLYDSFTVSSGSMEPDIPENAVIFTQPVRPEEISRNDVITFRDTSDLYTTHRVVDVVSSEEGLRFQTKGDANEDADPGLVEEEEVVGKVFLSIPFIGGIIYFARTPTGIFLMIGLPALGLLLWELYVFIREVSDFS